MKTKNVSVCKNIIKMGKFVLFVLLDALNVKMEQYVKHVINLLILLRIKMESANVRVISFIWKIGIVLVVMLLWNIVILVLIRLTA